MGLTVPLANNTPPSVSAPLPYSGEANQPVVKAPPGSIGHSGAIPSQLAQGNPGGAGVASGIGINLDSGA